MSDAALPISKARGQTSRLNRTRSLQPLIVQTFKAHSSCLAGAPADFLTLGYRLKPLAQDSALIDAGLDFALGPNTTAGVSYTGQFGDGVSDKGVKGRLTWLF